MKHYEIFTSLGVEIIRADTQSRGVCPFCDGKFFLNNETGQWDCKNCGEKGNLFSFLNKLYEMSKQYPDNFDELQSEKSLDPTACNHFGLVRNPLNQEILIPAYNHRNKLTNLYRVVRLDQKLRAIGLKGLKNHPMGPVPVHQHVIVTEGPWDAINVIHQLAHVAPSDSPFPGKLNGKRIRKGKNILSQISVVASPGVHAFQKQQFTKVKQMLFLFDNDHDRARCSSCRRLYPVTQVECPACKSRQQEESRTNPAQSGLIKIANSLPETIEAYYLHWGEEDYFDEKLANGYDFSDLCHESKNPWSYIVPRIKPIQYLQVLAEETEEEEDTIAPCETFEELVQAFHDGGLHMSKTIEDTLAVICAVIISTELPEEQLWFRIIGPPGSCKTTLVEAVGHSKKYTFSRSLVKGFHSGFVPHGQDKGKDTSLIPLINGKTMIIKDADTLLTAAARDTILAQLRDIFDGSTSAHYLNMQSKVYENLRVTFLLCGTDELRKLNRSSLGERFLDIEVFDESQREVIVSAATQKSLRSFTDYFKRFKSEDQDQYENWKEPIKRKAAGFITYLKERLPTIDPPSLPEGYRQEIERLGHLTAYMRAKVTRDRNGELEFVQRPELATRLSSQLCKLAFCLAIVFQKPRVDRQIMEIVRKVVHDTSAGPSYRIITFLADKGGQSLQAIAKHIKRGMTMTRRYLDELSEFNIVSYTTRPNNTGRRGAHYYVWQLTPEIYRLVKPPVRKNRKKIQGKSRKTS